MAWEDADETIVAGGGQVYVAAVGTALPTDADDSLNAAFSGLGYHSEDGVSMSNAPEITAFPGWQARKPIRRQRSSDTFQVTYALLQWNEVTLPHALGGGEISSTSNGYRYSPPADSDELDEKSLVVDIDDGDRRMRIVIPKGNSVETVESQFTRTTMGMLPVTFEALDNADGDDYYILFSDETAFAAGS